MLTLVEAVQEMTLRTMRAMHAAHLTFQYPDGNAWKINNPVTGDKVERGGGVGDLLPHAYLFRLSQEWIIDAPPMSLAYAIAFDYFDVLGVTYVPWPDPSGLIEGILAGQIYFPPWNNIVVDLTKYFNDKGKLILSAISDYGMGSSIERLILFTYFCGHVYNKYLPSNLDVNLQKSFAFDDVPLFHYVLHGQYNMSNDYWFDYYMSYVEQLLNTAPTDGPEFYGNLDINNFEWISGNRLAKPVGIAYNEYVNEGIEYFSEEPGLDYMLLHNLYLISYYQRFNLTRNITEDFPIIYNYDDIITETLGTINNQVLLTVNSLESITATNKIHYNAKSHPSKINF